MQPDYRNADAGSDAEREVLLDMVCAHPQQRQANGLRSHAIRSRRTSELHNVAMLESVPFPWAFKGFTASIQVTY
jgi:hypothetical protein